MKLTTSLHAVLAISSLAFAIPDDGEIVTSKTLRLSIEEAELMSKAQTIEAFAYASPGRNRFIGTPGFEDTMQYVWDTLDDLDYYDLTRQDFEVKYWGGKIKTYNIVAQTKGGDPGNVLHLGAHMDSVQAGPGMNDDASGGIGILEVATQLANYTVNNAVRFSWWSGEEEGLIGSKRYVESLSEEEREKIRLYLNFDMIASSDSECFGVYSSEFSRSTYDFTWSDVPEVPPGVKEAEELLQTYFDKIADLGYCTVNVQGNSDHWPFALAGIPIGGLHAGSDPYYHTANDTVANMDPFAFVEITKAIAHAVATYAVSFDSLPPRDGVLV